MPSPQRGDESKHHFRPPSPSDIVEVPAPVAACTIVGPRRPRPWYLLVLGQWPMFVTLLSIFVGVLVAGAGYWRRGSTIIGAGVLMAAALRLLLPAKMAGLLGCRSKTFDVVITGLVGAGIVVFAWVIDPIRK